MKNTYLSQLKVLQTIPSIQLAYVFGSVCNKKNKKQKSADVDVLIIVDDYVEEAEKELILKTISVIEKKEPDIHIQPPLTLSSWWKSVMDGEPWILTSIKSTQTIIDRLEILSEIADLVQTEATYEKKIRQEQLIVQSQVYSTKNRYVLLESLHRVAELYKEVAELFLFRKQKVIFEPHSVYEELGKYEESSKFAYYYKDILDLKQKADRGMLSEFTAEDLDYHLARAISFLDVLD